MTDKYRIVFAPDGEHWIDNKANDYADPSKAVGEARTYCVMNRQAKARVINPNTRAVIWDSEEEGKNPDTWIASTRRK